MGNNFTTALFPMPMDYMAAYERSLSAANPNFVGVCFSGGGSRALTCAMGQLRGLKYLDVLKDVFFISSVSGGTWASSLYTYLPPGFDEDEFLGKVVTNPYDLTFFNDDPRHPEYALDYLPPNNLGTIPTTLGLLSDIDEIIRLKEKYGYANEDLWQGLVGMLILEPWNLWNSKENGLPDKYYSYTAYYLGWNGGILDHNKQLTANQFYCVQRQRPLYVMNSCIVSNPLVDGSQLLPFESSPIAVGVRNAFPGIGPYGKDIGGGFIQPFAMGSSWISDAGNDYSIVTNPARPFSLCDMVGISSAAFADFLQTSFPILDSLIPKYNYWPVEGHAQPGNKAYNYDFADGGSLENTGITSLLNRNLPNIIAFVNGQTPLHKEDGIIVMDAQIALLFGIQPSEASLRYNEPNRQAVPNNDVSFTQVFDASYYDEVANGLYNANAAGGTAMYLQTLPVLPNENFGIEGNYTVRVLWVYNTKVPDWENLLRWDVYDYAQLVLNFPNYNTFYQLALSAREVNLLAQLSCWNVINDSSKQLINKLFYQ
jgi:hypothetical protein